MLDCATTAGTSAYAHRCGAGMAPGHFRDAQGLHAASIGLGTYLGDADAATDAAYRRAIDLAVQRGCNVIDSAINYRFQRSERAIGEALAALFAARTLQREEIVIATKGGYIPFDAAPPADPNQWFYDTFVTTGVATADDLVAGCHCMTPAYLRHQLATSLRNLRVRCVDIYYVHNPETQLEEVSREVLMERMQAAFAELEDAVAAGHIHFYGVATWNGLRQPESARGHLSLQALVRLAEQVGGPSHHFRAVQAPLNLAMPEVLTQRTQRLDGELVSLLVAAERLGMTFMASASMLQGQLSRRLPAGLREVITDLTTDAQRAIQFVRSTPGVSAALVGMKQTAHVEENLAVAHVAPLSESQFMTLFGSGTKSR